MRNFIHGLHFLLLAITSVSCISVQAQDYLLHKKSNVEKRLSKYGNRNDERAFVYATDSTLRLSVQDSTKRKMDITCYFDKKGSCYKETKTTDCDECFQKYLNEALSRKMYKWKKVSDKLYVSNKFWNMYIVIDDKTAFSYSIIHNYMNKQKQKKKHESIR